MVIDDLILGGYFLIGSDRQTRSGTQLWRSTAKLLAKASVRFD